MPLFAGIAGIASPLYMQSSRLLLGALALPRGGGFRTNPAGGLLFQASDGWPPFVIPSGPFWLVSVAMFILIVVAQRNKANPLDFALQPFVLSFWCGLGAFYAWLHSQCFVDLDSWPRDSLVAAFVLAAECLVFLFLGVARVARSVRVRSEVQGAHGGAGRPAASAGLSSGDGS